MKESSEMHGGSPLTLNTQSGSTRHWMLILVTCVYIMRRCRSTYINKLNVRVCELICKTTTTNLERNTNELTMTLLNSRSDNSIINSTLLTYKSNIVMWEIL